MIILQIIYSLSSGGAERFVVDLSNELAKLGNDVVLCTFRNDVENDYGFYKEEISSKVTYVNLKLELGFRAGNINLLRQLIKEIKPDVIHCHQNLVNYIFPLTIIFPTIKFFHTIHNDAPKEVSNALEYYFRRFFYSLGIVKAITISNETSQSFIKYYKTKNYHEIYNGRKQPLPSSEFKKVKDYIDGIRIKSDLVFLHIARCAPQKNQKMLIEVFNRLIDEGKSVALIILGNGFDSPVGDELKLMASEMIYFLGIKPNVADYYLNSDAFCLSSIHEGMPITLIEAFACGCVPICTPVGGISDSIENGITGFLSKSISADEYYKAILAYIEQKVKINKEYLIEHYNLRFSIRGCAHQHIKLFEK